MLNIKHGLQVVYNKSLQKQRSCLSSVTSRTGLPPSQVTCFQLQVT